MAAVPSTASRNETGRDRLGGRAVSGTLHEAFERRFSGCRACNPILIRPVVIESEHQKRLSHTIRRSEKRQQIESQNLRHGYSSTLQKSLARRRRTSRVTVA